MRLHKVILGFLGVVVLVVFVAACKSPPPPKPVSAVCNPVPVSSPPLPNFIDSITNLWPELYGPVHSLHAAGDTIYMGLGDSFAVLDASNAAEPQLIGSVYLNEFGRHGFDLNSIRQDIAYLASHFQYMGFTGYKIDLSNPADPVEVYCDPPVPIPNQDIFAGRYEISYGSANGISIGEWSEDGSEIQEISTFALYTPTRIEWQQPPGQLVPLPYRFDPEPMRVVDFTFDERYLYVLNAEYRYSLCCGRINILDLENPADPKTIHTIILPAEYTPESIIAAGDFLLVTYYDSPTIRNTTIFDMREKEALIELLSVFSSQAPQVHNGLAYFTHWPELDRPNIDIDIWDLYAENGPALTGKIITPEITDVFFASFANKLAFIGDYLYLANDRTLEILDNRDPANPAFVNRMQFPLYFRPIQIAVTNNRLAAIMIGNDGRHVFQILKINETGQAGEWETLPRTLLSDFAYDLAIVDDYFFSVNILNANSPDELITTLQSFDVSRTAEFSPTATLTFEGFSSNRVAAGGSRLYLLESDIQSKVQIVDISEPDNPTPAGELVLEQHQYSDLAVWEDRLFLASDSPENGLWQYDLTNPDEPAFVGTYPLDNLNSITAGDGYLFGLDRNSNILIFDVHSSDGLALLETFQLYDGSLQDLTYQDGTLYVAVINRGVAALKLNFENLK